VNLDRLRQVAGAIPIVEDCAHAAGARYAGRHVGTFGTMGCFSFHAVKNLAMGEGGALVLNDEAMAGRAKRLRWLGIDKGTWDRTKLDRSYWWEYSVDEVGLKSHLNDLHAAIGLVQLAKLDAGNARRKALVQRYRRELQGIAAITLPPDDDPTYSSSWHLCEVRAERRDELSQHLREQGIHTGVHYKPVHLYRCYGDQPKLPVAEAVFPKLLTLPLYPALTDDDMTLICDAIKDFYR
jgi:perosamine synthetase